MKMQKTHKTGWLLSALMAALIVTSANGGIKYWDNPEYKAFDVGDYVQDGLVVNYDGIRNAGLDQPHSMTTTTWKNLGSFGSAYDLTRTNWTDGRGAWEDEGYRFTTEVGNAAHFDSPTISWNLSGQNRTIQIACDVNRTDRQSETTTRNLGYLFYGYSGTKVNNNDSWRWFSVGIRSDQNAGTNGVYSLACNLDYTYAPGNHFDYVTSILGEDYVSTFTGTVPPTSGTFYTGYTRNASKRGDMATITKFTLGGSNSQGLTGKIKNVRYYNRVLEQPEIAWNRAVDDARFFGKAVQSIPVTNVVVISSVPSVSGNQMNGNYAVDAGGFTFTAPAATNVNGRVYTLTGYTLETWDDGIGAWGAVAVHDGGSSYTATNGGKVRLTWQWTAGDGLVTYDVNDYVQEGLVLNYDGIRNDGAYRPHSTNAMTWVNVANPGFHDLAHSQTTVPDWRKDGCGFFSRSSFKDDAFDVSDTYTVQATMDMSTRAIPTTTDLSYLWFSAGDDNKNWTKWSCSVRRLDAIWFNTHLFTKDRPKWSNVSRILYFNGVANKTYAAAFEGTEEPTATPGRYEAKDGTNYTAFTVSGWALGGQPAGWDFLRGIVKSFRYYDRVLTKAELEHNRMVDNARFWGVLPVTNVVVSSTHLFLPGNEADGQYQVSGSYTFTAPVAATDRGIDYALDGYTIETWTDGEWGAAVKHEGSSYAYTTAAGKVRLTWQWKATHGLRTAADYDAQDYVGAGLFLNYDGIRNMGLGNEHNSTSNAVQWVNLAPSGPYYDISIYGGLKEWQTDGFLFAADRTFRSARGLTVSTHYTFQTLIDANSADHDSKIGYVFFPPQVGTDNLFWQKCSIGIRKNANGAVILANSLYLVNDIPLGGRPCIIADHFTYATAMMDGDHSVIFEGTEAPTSGTIATGYKSKGSSNTPEPYALSPYWVGPDFNGAIKNVRYYDRVLTTDEMVRNRNVDSARYFGVLGVTNVFVVAGGEGAVQTEAGAYKVDGEWTFTASKTVNKRGQMVDVVRYSTEELVNGAWANKTYHNGSTYTYTEGSSPATVRLKWLGQPLGTRIEVQ